MRQETAPRCDGKTADTSVSFARRLQGVVSLCVLWASLKTAHVTDITHA